MIMRVILKNRTSVRTEYSLMIVGKLVKFTNFDSKQADQIYLDDIASIHLDRA